MRFSPKTFWGMSLAEFTSACEGYLLKNGKGGKTGPITQNELKELMERFPD